MHLKIINIFNYLLVFNVFAGAFLLPGPASFEFYLGYIFIALFLIVYIFRCRSLSVNLSFFIILTILTISSVINIFLGNGTAFLLAKQFIGLLMMSVSYYLLLKANDFNVGKLFKIYLNIALIVAVIGIIQEISFLIDFRPGYDYSFMIQKWRHVPTGTGILRVNSIFMEPSHFAISMAPAFFVSLLNIFKKGCGFSFSRFGSMLVIVSYFLTLSIVSYIVALVSLFLLPYRNKKKCLLIILIIGILFSVGSYLYLPEIRSRVDDTIGVATGSVQTTRSHLTVYAYHSNGFVAFKSFIKNFLFGQGLGSHPVSYDKLIRPDEENIFWQEGYTGVNKKDANCLFLRLVSETGLVGLVVVFYFIFAFRVRNKRDKDSFVLSNAVFLLFVAQLIRQGHYFANGLFFFVWLYYFAYKTSEFRENEKNSCYIGN